MAGILFIISAPSGSGKSTLVSEVRRLVEGLEFSISYTTREPRGSEEDGREYHFTSREEFERMVAAGEFLEWAEVFGNYYGTAIAALDHARDSHKDLLLDIDVQGALQVMQRLPKAVSIFILPPSPEVLEMRLRNRSQAEGMTRESVIETRLNNARGELQKIGDYKYALVNDVLDHAAAEMRAIVLEERGEHAEAGPEAATCLTRSWSPRLTEALASFGVHPEQELIGQDAINFARRLHEVFVSADGWVTEYVDPETGEKWVMDYPNSSAHGGGNPRLRRLPQTAF